MASFLGSLVSAFLVSEPLALAVLLYANDHRALLLASLYRFQVVFVKLEKLQADKFSVHYLSERRLDSGSFSAS
jgi:hypothetical protein